MGESIDNFISEYQASTLTKKAYRQTLELFHSTLNGNQPSEESVEKFVQKLEKDGLSSASINRHLSAIKAYFLWMKKKAPRERRPDFDLIVKGPKVQRKLPRLISAEEVQGVVDAAETPFETALIMTIYDGALRIAELMNLRSEDIDAGGGFIKITRKGGEETRVPVSEKTIQALKKYLGNRQGRIFTQPYWRLNYDLKRLGNRVGIRKLNPHQLRHARASDLRRQGVALEDIKDLLGHAQYQTTLIYARIMPSELKRRIPPAF